MARKGENIYKRKDGRYEGRYVIGKKENGCTRFGYIFGRSYAEVHQRLIVAKAEQMRKGTKAEQKKGSMENYMNKWLQEELRPRIKVSSYQTYMNLLNRHILPHIGRYDITEITLELVGGYIQRLRDIGLSDATINGTFTLLKSFMKDAHEQGLLKVNPCRRFRIKKEMPQKQRVLSVQEQEQLYKASEESDFPGVFSLYTGMRLGEISALKWEDIDFDKGTITVCRTVQRIKRMSGGTILMIGSPKTSRSVRVIPIPVFLIDQLKKLRENSTSSEYVFGKDTKPADPRTLQRHLERLTKNIGISHVHFHTLRHTYATRLMELGVDIKTISVLLGHASVKTTMDIYVHSLFATQCDAVKRITPF